MGDLGKKIVDQIKKIRNLRGIKQEEMANFLEISQQAYSSIERGESELSLNKLDKILEKLNVSIFLLLEFNHQHIYQSPFSTERILYEKHIEHLEKEILHLRQTVENLLKSK